MGLLKGIIEAFLKSFEGLVIEFQEKVPRNMTRARRKARVTREK